MARPTTILLIEDDLAIARSLDEVLVSEGYTVTHEPRGDTGLQRCRQGAFDVVLTDLKLPGLNGLDLVRSIRADQPFHPIILMTAHGTTETAIEAMKLGAYDYLVKPFRMEELLDLVRQAADCSRMISIPVELNRPTPARDALIGNSRAMLKIYKEIGRVAAKPVPVLIRGETGTGKELVARALCQHSDRGRAPFIAVNIAALPETLIESELFGHEKGAFTGAEARRIGRFEQAHGGTLFLDEIGDMPPGTQVKLLRVLQERCVQRLGGRETIAVDVRLIAATHRDLEQAIAASAFREDLYYRLCTVTLWLPPLRERREDIPGLFDYLTAKHGAELGAPRYPAPPDAIAYLQSLPWPGNVRQLENVVRQCLLAARGYPITVEVIRAALAGAASTTPSRPSTLAESVTDLLAQAERGEHAEAHGRLLEQAERELFTQAIDRAAGNQAKAARWLGVSRLTMREKLLRFGIHPDSGSRT